MPPRQEIDGEKDSEKKLEFLFKKKTFRRVRQSRRQNESLAARAARGAPSRRTMLLLLRGTCAEVPRSPAGTERLYDSAHYLRRAEPSAEYGA